MKIQTEKSQEELINTVIGQLNAVNRMSGEKKDCINILIQLKAVKAGISAIMDRFIAKEIDRCMQKRDTMEQKKLKKLIAEVNKK